MMIFSGHHDVYRICAVSEEERETWISCVKWVKPNRLTDNNVHACEFSQGSPGNSKGASHSVQTADQCGM